MLELDDYQFNDVLKDHEKMIYYLIHKLVIRNGEDEFYQEGAIALWKASKTKQANRDRECL